MSGCLDGDERLIERSEGQTPTVAKGGAPTTEEIQRCARESENEVAYVQAAVLVGGYIIERRRVLGKGFGCWTVAQTGKGSVRTGLNTKSPWSPPHMKSVGWTAYSLPGTAAKPMFKRTLRR